MVAFQSASPSSSRCCCYQHRYSADVNAAYRDRDASDEDGDVEDVDGDGGWICDGNDCRRDAKRFVIQICFEFGDNGKGFHLLWK
ncbi:hypothetical protein RHMOL_Rhmol05G0131700 [Rhododendron molle]|uniref:Uncharacterized protein n=1 Tax=Rhododendron molle TaxID=49168 RepID=A0ACC0NND6_RHOML|nr:hypothetical protein RHMOL_Rhmol05G0131700 [Rhododendron molle]